MSENNDKLAETIAELRRLQAAATSGEWEAENRGQRNWETVHIAIIDEKGKVICDTLNADGQEIHDESNEDGAYYFEGGQRDKDMDFIAAAHNHMPALLDALEDKAAKIERLKAALAALTHERDVLAEELSVTRTHSDQAWMDRDYWNARAEKAEAALMEAAEDKADLDWLEGELERERAYLAGKIDYMPMLFMQNMPITRAAIRAARGAKP